MDGLKSAVLLNSTGSYTHLGCHLTMTGLRRLAFSSGINIAFEWEHGVDLSETSLASYLDKNPESLIIINGEGTFHSDQPTMLKLLHFCEPYFSRTLLLNSQFFNVSDSVSALVKKLRLVQIRNMNDCRAARSIGINAIYCPDMLFFSGMQSTFGNRQGYSLFVDSHSKNASKLICDQFHRFDKEKRWLNFHYKNIRLPSRTDKIILGVKKYIPFVGSMNNYRLQNRLNTYLPSKSLEIFDDASTIYTGRYHAVCLALHLKKNIVAFPTNTPKIKNLLVDYMGEEVPSCDGRIQVGYSEEAHKEFIEISNRKYLELSRALVEV